MHTTVKSRNRTKRKIVQTTSPLRFQPTHPTRRGAHYSSRTHNNLPTPKQSQSKVLRGTKKRQLDETIPHTPVLETLPQLNHSILTNNTRFLPSPQAPIPLLLKSSVEQSYPDHDIPTPTSSSCVKTALLPTTLFPLHPNTFTTTMGSILPQFSQRIGLKHDFQSQHDDKITPITLFDGIVSNIKGLGGGIHESVQLGMSNHKSWTLYVNQHVQKNTVLAVIPLNASLRSTLELKTIQPPSKHTQITSPQSTHPFHVTDKWIKSSHILLNMISTVLSNAKNDNDKNNHIDLDPSGQTNFMFRLLIERNMGMSSPHYSLISSFPCDYPHLSSLDNTSPLGAENGNILLQKVITDDQSTFHTILRKLHTTKLSEAEKLLVQDSFEFGAKESYQHFDAMYLSEDEDNNNNIRTGLKTLPRAQRNDVSLFQFLYQHLHYTSMDEFIEQLIWAFYTTTSYGTSLIGGIDVGDQNQMDNNGGNVAQEVSINDYNLVNNAKNDMNSFNKGLVIATKLQSPPESTNNRTLTQLFSTPLRKSDTQITPLLHLVNTSEFPNCTKRLISMSNSDIVVNIDDKENNDNNQTDDNNDNNNNNNNNSDGKNEHNDNNNSNHLYHVLVAIRDINVGDEITIPYFPTKDLIMAIPSVDEISTQSLLKNNHHNNIGKGIIEQERDLAILLRTTFSIQSLFLHGLTRFPPAVNLMKKAKDLGIAKRLLFDGIDGDGESDTMAINTSNDKAKPTNLYTIPLQHPTNGLITPIIHGFMREFNWGEQLPLHGLNMGLIRHLIPSYFYLANDFKSYFPPSFWDDFHNQQQLDDLIVLNNKNQQFKPTKAISNNNFKINNKQISQGVTVDHKDTQGNVDPDVTANDAHEIPQDSLDPPENHALYSFREELNKRSHDSTRSSSLPRRYEPHLHNDPLLSYDDAPVALRGLIVPMRYPHVAPNFSTNEKFLFLKELLLDTDMKLQSDPTGISLDHDMRDSAHINNAILRKINNTQENKNHQSQSQFRISSPSLLGWDGPTPLLWALCRLYAIGSHYIAPPQDDVYHTPPNTNVNNSATTVTKSQSFNIVYDRIEERGNNVLTQLESTIKQKYNLPQNTHWKSFTKMQWLDVLTTPFGDVPTHSNPYPFTDVEVEHGAMLMLYLMVATQVQDLYSTTKTSQKNSNTNESSQNKMKILTIPHLIQSLDYTFGSFNATKLLEGQLETGIDHTRMNDHHHVNDQNCHALALNYLVDYQHAMLYMHTLKVLSIRLGLDYFDINSDLACGEKKEDDQACQQQQQQQQHPRPSLNVHHKDNTQKSVVTERAIVKPTKPPDYQIFFPYLLDAVVASSKPYNIDTDIPKEVLHSMGVIVEDERNPESTNGEKPHQQKLYTHNIYSVRSNHFIHVTDDDSSDECI